MLGALFRRKESINSRSSQHGTMAKRVQAGDVERRQVSSFENMCKAMGAQVTRKTECWDYWPGHVFGPTIAPTTTQTPRPPTPTPTTPRFTITHSQPPPPKPSSPTSSPQPPPTNTPPPNEGGGGNNGGNNNGGGNTGGGDNNTGGGGNTGGGNDTGGTNNGGGNNNGGNNTGGGNAGGNNPPQNENPNNGGGKDSTQTPPPTSTQTPSGNSNGGSNNNNDGKNGGGAKDRTTTTSNGSVFEVIKTTTTDSNGVAFPTAVHVPVDESDGERFVAGSIDAGPNMGGNTSLDENVGGAKSSNTGAIVGGVLGALALIAVVLLAVLLVRRRKRRQRVAPSAEFMQRYGNSASLHASTPTPSGGYADDSDVRNPPSYTQGSHPFAPQEKSPTGPYR